MPRVQRQNIVTAASIEKTVQQHRELEIQKRQLQEYSVESAKLLSAANFQSKVESRRLQATQELEKNEKIKQEKLLEAEKEKRMRERLSSQQSAINTQLEKEAAEVERQRLEIQRICEESPELKELEKALKVAYLNKDRAIQLEEKILIAEKEKERILAMEEEMETQRQISIKSDQNKMDQQKYKFLEQRRILQDQINERKNQFKESQKQVERDREMVDNIVQQIDREDEADYRKKKEMQAATAKMIRDFEVQRQQERAMALQEEKAEEERIRLYNEYLDTRKEGQIALKQAKKDEEDRLLKQIIEETEKKRKEEEEYNNLRDLLWEEELEKKRRDEIEMKKSKLRDNQKQMLHMNQSMLQTKEKMRLMELQEEMKLIETMNAKFQEDQKRDQMEEKARRIARENHKLILQKQLNDKKMFSEQEKRENDLLIQEYQRKEEYRQKIVQEARKRLLEEHANQLKGFIPTGTFRSMEEYQKFN
jgi:hypothetical protein